MAVKLQLKKRKTDKFFRVPVAHITAMVSDNIGGKDRLFNYFSGFREAVTEIHDSVHLRTIVNWTPDGGLPMTERAEWHRLAPRVGDLDEEKEGQFTLTDYQDKLIWKRLQSPEFKIMQFTDAWDGFILDYLEASGHHFSDEEPERKEEKPKSKRRKKSSKPKAKKAEVEETAEDDEEEEEIAE